MFVAVGIGMNMTMTLNPNGLTHGAPVIAPQPGMGLMALMATALPPTQMSVLPSIIDASSKTAAAPTEAGQGMVQGALGNGSNAPVHGTPVTNETASVSNNNNGSALVKLPQNGSRQSLTTNTVLERSPSSGSQILVPSALKSSLPKLSCVGDINMAGAVGGGVNGSGTHLTFTPSSHPSLASTPLLSVVSNNGKPFLQDNSGSGAKTSLMLTFDGDNANSGKVGTTPGYSIVGPATAHESSTNSDCYDPEEDIMYRV